MTHQMNNKEDPFALERSLNLTKQYQAHPRKSKTKETGHEYGKQAVTCIDPRLPQLSHLQKPMIN